MEMGEHRITITAQVEWLQCSRLNSGFFLLLLADQVHSCTAIEQDVLSVCQI